MRKIAKEHAITDDGGSCSDPVLEPPEGRQPPEEKVDYDLQGNIGFLLRTANQFAVSGYNQYMSATLELENVTTTQFAVLTSLRRFPGTSFSRLSKFTSIDMPTLNSMITRLLDRGLLIVKINPLDKRSRQIFLTPEGREIADKLTRHGNRIGHFISKGLSKADLSRLKTLLRKIQNA